MRKKVELWLDLRSPFSYLAKVILLTAIYGAILTPIFYPALRRAVAATHAGRVVRF